MPSLLRGLLVGSYCTCLSGSPSGPSRCDATFSCKYLVTVQRPIPYSARRRPVINPPFMDAGGGGGGGGHGPRSADRVFAAEIGSPGETGALLAGALAVASGLQYVIVPLVM